MLNYGVQALRPRYLLSCLFFSAKYIEFLKYIVYVVHVWLPIKINASHAMLSWSDRRIKDPWMAQDLPGQPSARKSSNVTPV